MTHDAKVFGLICDQNMKKNQTFPPTANFQLSGSRVESYTIRLPITQSNGKLCEQDDLNLKIINVARRSL